MTILLPPSLQISYQRVGSGRPLVFLHAFPLSSAMWQPQIEEFSGDYEVIALDARGFGETSAFDDPPSVEALAHDLNAVLADLGITEKIVLCGLSMGGYAALAFARLFPSQLAALVLADTRADTDTPDGKKGRNEMITLAQEQGAEAVAEKMLPKLLGETTLREQPDVVAKVKAMALQNNGASLAQAIAALRDRHDSTSYLESFGFPTLVIGGAEDVPAPPEVMAKMAAAIPHAKHVVIPNVGHLSNLEAPKEFNQALREFLRELKG
jgi:3-oxoadipate enol-lactonase